MALTTPWSSWHKLSHNWKICTQHWKIHIFCPRIIETTAHRFRECPRMQRIWELRSRVIHAIQHKHHHPSTCSDLKWTYSVFICRILKRFGILSEIWTLLQDLSLWKHGSKEMIAYSIIMIGPWSTYSIGFGKNWKVNLDWGITVRAYNLLRIPGPQNTGLPNLGAT